MLGCPTAALWAKLSLCVDDDDDDDDDGDDDDDDD